MSGWQALLRIFFSVLSVEPGNQLQKLLIKDNKTFGGVKWERRWQIFLNFSQPRVLGRAEMKIRRRPRNEFL